MKCVPANVILGLCTLILTVPSAHAAPGHKPARPKPAATGKVLGTVIFVGHAPDRKPLVRDTDPYCAKTPKLAEDVVVTNGKLKDVVVRVVDPPRHASLTSRSVRLDQRECMYTPRVLVVPPNPQFTVHNSDGTFHNVHGSIQGHLLWNKPQAGGDPDLSLGASAKVGDVIDIVCNVHPWMHAYAMVVDHPFAAVTGADGKFEITGLPPGAYTLEAWHPTLGKRTLNIRIGRGAKGTVPARISYKTD